MGNCKKTAALSICLFVANASLALAGDNLSLPDFSSLSLEQLANVKITSFTKKQQKLSQVAGAVYVITQEQIARSGLTSVPELLRLAPGIDVERINGSQWSISARGTVGAYSNKLLVMIDGRSLYSPIFAGVYWELGMPLLEDIDRIEVIRGPGATVWGANAVLGVINIITKNSKDLQGTTVTSAVGTSDRAFGNVRTGGSLGAITYRGFFGGSDNAALKTASGASAGDGWTGLQAGFRLDSQNAHGSWLLEGNLSRTSETEIGVYMSVPSQSVLQIPGAFSSMTANVSGEWRRRVGEAGEFRVESYYDHSNHPEPQTINIESDVLDVEAQYDFKAGETNNLSVGGGERFFDLGLASSQAISFTLARSAYSNTNGFARDEMHFAHDRLVVTVGAKLEHNHFGGRGVEPSANAIWMPSKHHSLWISAARSLRTPTELERSVIYPFTIEPASPQTLGLPVLVDILGSRSFAPETVRDYEIGYRTQPSTAFSLDIATFYNQYSSIRSWTDSTPQLAFSTVPYLLENLAEGNYSRAIGKGIEASFAWEVSKQWKLEGSYTYNIVDPYLSPSAPPGTEDAGGKLPSHNKWRLQSYLNLSRRWKVDSFLYWTSAASPTNTWGPPIPVPSWTRLDVRIGYKVRPNWELSFAGQNLLRPTHLEGLTEVLTAFSYVNRSVYLRSTWQF